MYGVCLLMTPDVDHDQCHYHEKKSIAVKVIKIVALACKPCSICSDPSACCDLVALLQAEKRRRRDEEKTAKAAAKTQKAAEKVIHSVSLHIRFRIAKYVSLECATVQLQSALLCCHASKLCYTQNVV